MSMINIDKLHKKKEQKESEKKKVYEVILKKCHHRIKTVAGMDNNGSFCFYVIPNYIYGVPLYDLKSCIIYVVVALIKNGFDVKYTHPNLLYISWLGKSNPKPKAIEYPKPFNKPIDKPRTTDSYRPSKNLIYDTSSLDLFRRKSDKFLK